LARLWNSIRAGSRSVVFAFAIVLVAAQSRAASYRTSVPGTTPTQVTVYSFSGAGSPADDGIVPKGSLVELGGILYGRTTATEPTVNSDNPTGVAFAFDPTQPAGSNYSIIHNFAGAVTDGADPRHDAMTAYGNLLLGATQSGGEQTARSCGGAIGCGTIYSIDVSTPSSPVYCLVHSFAGQNAADPAHSDGAQEHSSFVQAQLRDALQPAGARWSQ
jgi:hypothetical protein